MRYFLTLEDNSKVEVFLGQDVGSLLNIEKFSPIIPTCMSGEVCYIGRENTINYDIENLKRYPDILQEGENVSVTEKLHGCADYDILVETQEYGVLKIGEICEKEIICSVKSFNISKQEIEFQNIEGFSILENNDNWYEILCSNGTILKLTGNHKIWVQNLQCYRKIEDLDGSEILLTD